MDIKQFEKDLIQFDLLIEHAEKSIKIMECCVDDAVLDPVQKTTQMYNQWLRKRLIELVSDYQKEKNNKETKSGDRRFCFNSKCMYLNKYINCGEDCHFRTSD